MYEQAYLIEPIRQGERIYDTFLLHAMSNYVCEELETTGTVIMPVVNQPSVEVEK